MFYKKYFSAISFLIIFVFFFICWQNIEISKASSTAGCILKINNPYKTKNNPAVFFITSACTKKAFVDMKAYLEYFSSKKNIKLTTDTALSKISQDKDFFIYSKNNNKKSCLLQAENPYKIKNKAAIYFITTDCTKKAFYNMEAFYEYYASKESISFVTNNVINKIPNDKDFLILPKTSCNYNNLKCDANHSCINHKCVLNSGCLYNNPMCGINYDCVNNICVLKKNITNTDNNTSNYTTTSVIDKNSSNTTTNSNSGEGYGCQVYNFSCKENSICWNNNCQPVQQVCTNQQCLNSNIDYLIITRPIFNESGYFQDFVKWKKDNGFKVGLLTVEWINKNYSGKNVAEKIKNAIYDNNFNGGKKKYVLLVGDTQENLPTNFDGDWYEPTEMYDLNKEWNVPTGVFLTTVSDMYGVYNYMSFSDLYFADKDELPLNSSGHPFIQPPDTFFDFEMIVGRLPIRFPAEINNILKKSQIVKPVSEVNFVLDTNLNKPLQEDKCKDPSILESGDIEKINKDTECYTDLNYSTDKALLNSGISLNKNILDVFNSTELEQARSLIFNNSGVLLVNSHGLHTLNEMFSNADVSKFKNIFPLYVAASCMNNAFYDGAIDSLTETLLKSEKGPAVVLGLLDRYFFYKDLLNGKSVGEAFFSSLKLHRGQWILQDLLGDPSLKIFNIK